MKNVFVTFVALLLLVAASAAFAKGNTPSLLGKWSTDSMGGVMLAADQPGKDTHWKPQQKVLKGVLEFKTQDGRFVTGTFTSERGSENFIGMLSADGKRLYLSDTDGFTDVTLVNKDTMELVYRHAKPTDSVVAVGTAKRQK